MSTREKLKELKIIIFFFRFLLVLILVSIVSCQPSPSSLPKVQSQVDEQPKGRIDTQLVLNNAILEQSNKQDNTVWKIKANTITYSEDQKTAILDDVVGNLLQDKQIIFRISAKQGEVKDNGNIIVLKQDIVAQDPRNDSIIKSDAVEWQPQKNLLWIKSGLQGINANLNVTAQTGRYFTNTESLSIEGDVVATTEQPPLQLTSNHLTWDIAQNKVISPETVTIVRYNQTKVTDRLVSDRAELDLTTNIATLTKNIELVSLQPELQAATESLIWNYQSRSGRSDKPIQILDHERKISLTGNQGSFDFEQQIAKLEKGVKGINQQNPSELYAHQLTWQIDTKKLEATGNVIYQQTDPSARLTGEKAVGILSDNNIVVTSNGKKPVTSIIENR